ncbi:MAG: uroporphyrinogen decarboxylase family protein [Eubacteriales bacterium]
MNARENYLSIIKRTGYDGVVATYWLCPHLEESYGDRLRKFVEDNQVMCPEVRSRAPKYVPVPDSARLPFFDPPLKEGGTIDVFGVGHEKGSAAAMHMTYMRSPLEKLHSVEELEKFPFAKTQEDPAYLAEVLAENEALKAQDKIVMGDMQMTVWERSWYLRRMERMMVDMMIAPDQATFILDKITALAIEEAEFYTKAGCDVLFFGDDVGMQNSILMSLDTYRTWLKPRIIRVIEAAKAINPQVVIMYHSCGFVEPFIDDLIDAGVEVLDPVQPECMEFSEIAEKYGDRISFHGSIGTQTTMPKGTPSEVYHKVMENLKISGKKGGLLVCPTHMLEPEVPVENIEAYLLACRDFNEEM